MEDEINKLRAAVEKIASYAVSYSGGNFYREVHEILYPPAPNEFLECDTCRAKPGSPQLCKGCLHNRTLIEKLSHTPTR